MSKSYFTFLIMGRYELNDSKNNIFFVGGISLILLFIYNGIYFMMPLDTINPFEYFYGTDLNVFNITDVFVGGSVIPLISIIIGYLLSQYRYNGRKYLAKVLVFVLLLITLSTILIYGSDMMPFVILMAFIGLIFVGRHWIITLASSLMLFALHLMINVVLEIITGLNSNIQHVYSGIQQVNNYVSTYRSTDYLAIMNLNVETLTNGGFETFYSSIFMILPWILLGIAFKEMNILNFMRTNPYLSGALIIVLLAGGIATKLLQILSLGSITGETLGEGFGGPTTAIGYFLVLLYISSAMPKVVFNVFVNLGKHGLTAYFIFNIIMMFIFYGFGLSMYGETSVQILLIIVVALYILLTILMNIFMKSRINGIELIFQTNKKMNENN